MSIGIFIPGRLQSQRLPRKLTLPIGDTCLWDIALRKLNKLPPGYEKVALCNDKPLVTIAKKYPNIEIILRDDDTKVDGDLRFIYKNIREMESSHLMFLNPCLPMLKPKTISSALAYFEIKDIDYMESVKPFKNWVFDEEGKAVSLINYRRMSTKELPVWYLDANAFRVFNKKQFFKDGCMIKRGHGIFPISETEAIDVDTREDFRIAKAVYEGL